MEIPTTQIQTGFPSSITAGVNSPIAAFRSRKNDGFITSAKSGIDFWHPKNNKIKKISHPEKKYNKTRLNDEAIDDYWYFWVGSINHDGFGYIYRINP